MTKKEAVDKINNWRNEAKSAKGAKIGVGGSNSLYNVGLGHADKARSADRGGKGKVSGLGTFIKPITILEIFLVLIPTQVTHLKK